MATIKHVVRKKKIIGGSGYRHGAGEHCGDGFCLSPRLVGGRIGRLVALVAGRAFGSPCGRRAGGLCGRTEKGLMDTAQVAVHEAFAVNVNVNFGGEWDGDVTVLCIRALWGWTSGAGRTLHAGRVEAGLWRGGILGIVFCRYVKIKLYICSLYDDASAAVCMMRNI